MRARESLRRNRLVRLRSYDNWLWTDPHADWCIKALPIYDWEVDDVWAAPRVFGWDYCRTYDVFTRLGISKNDQRVCPPFGEEPLRSLWMYAQGWPELWERMIGRVEGAATAARYSRSPLYSFSAKRRAPEPGKTWQQMIQEALAKWEPDTRREVAKQIQFWIAKHNRDTRNAPIPDFSETGDGLSWSFLHTIAVRGDTKRRRFIFSMQTKA